MSPNSLAKLYTGKWWTIVKIIRKVFIAGAWLFFAAISGIIVATGTKGTTMAEGYLTTHVLDTARGLPAEGMKISLYRVETMARSLVREMVTNDDGRTDGQILPKGEFREGVYELVFEAGAYLDATGTPPESPRFLDVIPIRFGISDVNSHYHVPLLISPFGYSTYRGS